MKRADSIAIETDAVESINIQLLNMVERDRCKCEGRTTTKKSALIATAKILRKILKARPVNNESPESAGCRRPTKLASHPANKTVCFPVIMIIIIANNNKNNNNRK